MIQAAGAVITLVSSIMVLAWLFTRRQPRTAWLCTECGALHNSPEHARDCARAAREPAGTWTPSARDKLLIAGLLITTPLALLSLAWLTVDLLG